MDRQTVLEEIKKEISRLEPNTSEDALEEILLGLFSRYNMTELYTEDTKKEIALHIIEETSLSLHKYSFLRRFK